MYHNFICVAGVITGVFHMAPVELFAMIASVTLTCSLLVLFYVLLIHELISIAVSTFCCKKKSGCTNGSCIWRAHCTRPLGRLPRPDNNTTAGNDTGNE